MKDKQTLLEVDGLRKEFGGLVAVDDLSFKIKEGEIVGFIGPNGSGKTTVFNCIMGKYPPSKGRITFKGTNISNKKTHSIVNKGLARVSQESNPVPDMPLYKNIKLFTLPNKATALSGGATTDEIYEIAARVGLKGQIREKPDSLPHAGVRRLEIAKTLATQPDMLLLDEPFAGMNKEEIGEISNLISKLHQQGITIVIVDHNMNELMSLVDRVIVINNGQLLAEGNPEEVANDRRVRKAYLGNTEEVEI